MINKYNDQLERVDIHHFVWNQKETFHRLNYQKQDGVSYVNEKRNRNTRKWRDKCYE